MDVVEVMKEHQVGVAGFMETQAPPWEDFSVGQFKWFKGPESTPHAGCGRPTRGMGAFVDTSRFAGAHVSWVGVFSFCVWLPAGKGRKPVSVFFCHLPGPTEPLRRSMAWKELRKQLHRSQHGSVNIVAGDLNSRAALNGDPELKPCGKELLDFCAEEGLVLANALQCCVGQFSREQPVLRRGVVHVDKTTVDYVCVDAAVAGQVRSLRILEKGQLDSDHKPLLLVMEGVTSAGSKVVPKPPLKQRYKLAGRRGEVYDGFEDACEPRMVGVLQASKQSALVSDQECVDAFAKAIEEALHTAAREHFGTKLVGLHSKPWFDREVKWVFDLKRRALGLTRLAGVNSVCLAEARVLTKDCKRLLATIIRAKRRAKDFEACRAIERSEGASKLFWARWAARSGNRMGSVVSEAVLDEKGGLVTGNLAVLAAWKRYVVKLGKDDFPSSSDRAIKDDDVFDDEAACAIMARIRSTLGLQGRLLELSNRVTWEEVHAAVRALDAGKSPGPDGVPSELLRLAGVAFEMVLVALFNEIWSTLRWPSQWSLASLVPLYKGDGDKLDPANSRTIALMSMLPKVFEKVLDRRLRSWAERVGGVSELQGGFRQDRSCPDQIFSLLEIISSRQEEKIDTYTCFLDVTKAYDRVWKPGLYYKQGGWPQP